LTLHIHPDDTLERVTDMLYDQLDSLRKVEFARKYMCVRAICNCAELLQTYDSIPPNGLLVCCGVKENPDRHVDLNFDIEIPSETSITRTLYIMDHKFHYACLGGNERQEFRLDLARHKEEVENLGLRIDEVKKEIQELKEWVDRPENPFNRV
jgi:peptide subunit release factor 1 (eRF1)